MRRETEVVTQLNTYTAAASLENNKAAVKALDDNDGSTDATVALATTKAEGSEILVKEGGRADFYNKEPLGNENDANVDKTREEEPEQSTAAVEEESLAETENDESKKNAAPTSMTKSHSTTRTTPTSTKHAKNNKAAVKERDDNDGSTDATVALATKKAEGGEILVKEGGRADFYNKEPLGNENDANVDKTREEEPEQSTAAVEEESLAETENDEVGKEDRIPKGKGGELEKHNSS
ncbi:hypothetical protein FQA39_LY02850 [Lamprigera yunnana]|nr:hypothetical protein FQA39_LY02850 [Lamprigera yunnana]